MPKHRDDGAQVAACLQRARTAAGLTQREVAGAIGVTISTVCGYEAGRRIPPNPLLARLAEMYHVSVADLDPALGQPTGAVAMLDRRLRDFLPVRAVPRIVAASSADMRSVLSGEAAPAGHILLDVSLAPEDAFAWMVPGLDSAQLGLRPGDVAICSRIGAEGPPTGSIVLADSNGRVMAYVLGRRSGKITLNADRSTRSALPDVDPSRLIAWVTRVVGRPENAGESAAECLEAQRIWPEAVSFILRHGSRMSPMTRRRVLSAMQGFLLLDGKQPDAAQDQSDDADASP